MALCKTTPEIQAAFKVDASTRIETIAPYIDMAQEKYLPKYLGDTLLASLDAWYNNDKTPANGWYDKLLPYVQKALINFAYYHASDDLNIHSGENGFSVVQNNNMAPASSDRSQKFKDNRQRLGFEAIELMLRFLEQNKSQFASWTSSSAYTISYKYPINTAEELNNIIDIDNSRLAFTKLWPHMDYAVSNNIVSAISQALYDKILADRKSGTLAGGYLNLLTPLSQALAYYAWAYKAEACQDTPTRALYYTKGQNALNTVLAILDANPSAYPEYLSSAQYADGRTSYQQVTPKTDSGQHVGGTF